MSEAERVELIRFVRSLLPRPKLLIAGAGMEGTRQTIAMGKAMAEAGADALLVLTPGYFKGMRLTLCTTLPLSNGSLTVVCLHSGCGILICNLSTCVLRLDFFVTAI